MIEVGQRLPEVLGKDQDGNEIKLSDFAGKKLVLYVYPKDNTPGCTNQACNIRDNYSALLREGYAILGASIQSEASHKKFIEKYSLPFPIIADTEKVL
ncbi:MAG: peroxiredoxin, partial [Muribaculaceae bacterium]